MHFICNSKKDESTSVVSEDIGDIKQTSLPSQNPKWHLAGGGWLKVKFTHMF